VSFGDWRYNLIFFNFTTITFRTDKSSGFFYNGVLIDQQVVNEVKMWEIKKENVIKQPKYDQEWEGNLVDQYLFKRTDYYGIIMFNFFCILFFFYDKNTLKILKNCFTIY